MHTPSLLRDFYFALAASAAMALAGCGGKTSASGPQGPPPMTVKVQVEQPTPIQDAADYVATLKSRDSTSISPQVDGQITQIYVKSGERVAAGAPLMQIDPLKQQATVGTQEATHASKLADLEYAQQQLQRTKQLYSEGVASKQNLDEAQSTYDRAKADVASLEAQVKQERVQLQYFRVLAPTAGVVGDIPVHVGDRVTTSTMLTTIDRTSALEAYVDVPVENAQGLKQGQTVELLDSDGKVAGTAKISFVSPRVNDQTQTVLVKAAVDNKQGTLRTQQFVRARVVRGTRPGLTVPVLAVSRINGQFFVFVAHDEGKGEVARQKQVQLGNIVGNNYVVLSGLQPGEKLIVSGLQFLADGAPVKSET